MAHDAAEYFPPSSTSPYGPPGDTALAEAAHVEAARAEYARSADSTVSQYKRLTSAPPSLTDVSPLVLTEHQDETLTLTGSGFTEDCVVYFDGDPIDTTFVSAQELTAEVVDPTYSEAVAVGVYDTETGQRSAVILVSVVAIPLTLTDVQPDDLVADVDATITLTGTGFDETCVASFDGAEIPTTFVSGDELTADVTAPAASAGVDVNVRRALTGDISDPITITVTTPFSTKKPKK